MSEEGRLYVLRPLGDRKSVEPKPFPFPASKDGQQQFPGLDMWGKGTARLLRDAAQPPPEGQGSFSSGLVSDTYQHKNALITHEGGGLLRLKCPSRREKMDLPPRGEITSFSKGSSRRFRLRLAMVLNKAFEQGVLLTMTYPEEMHEVLRDWEFYKRHLKAYWMAFRRQFPNASGFWKLEFQANGRPHYHCIVFGLGLNRDSEKLEDFIKWHSETWFRIVGSNLEKHLNAGTRAEFPKHGEASKNYIASYATKQEQQCPGFTGRYWGQFNSREIPWAPEVTETVTDYQAVILRRLFRKKMQSEFKERAWRRTLRNPGLYGVSLLEEGWTPLAVHYYTSQKSRSNPVVWRNRIVRVRENKRFIITHVRGGGWHVESENLFLDCPDPIVSTGDAFPRNFKSPKGCRVKKNDSFAYLGDASSMKRSLLRYLKSVSDRPEYEFRSYNRFKDEATKRIGEITISLLMNNE